MKTHNKKGIQLNQAFGAVLAVILVAVLVIIAIVLFDSLQSSFPTSTQSVTNESGGSITETGYALAGSSDCNFGSPSISVATNNTDSQVILVGNYSVSSIGVVTNATTTVWSDVNFTYTYAAGGDSCDAAANTITQFSTYPALVGLVGTIVFLGLVIGVLVGSFIFGGRREQI